jgi:hypothetical protein
MTGARLPRHRVKSYRTDAAQLAAAAWVDPYDPAHPIEEQFRQAAREIAKRLGWRCFHTRDSRGSDPGMPDEMWVRAPRIIFAELKAPKGAYTEEQRDTLALLQRCPGVEAYGIRSTGDRARDQASIAQLLGPHARRAA